jgi:iron-sulfur cluster assembly protein
LAYLGLEIDFEESGMSGGFTIHNPNAVRLWIILPYT